MAKHYIRDLRFTVGQEGGMPEYSVAIFHFLRVCGWSWLWECDGNAGDNPTHCNDANMETSGVGNWADVGTPTTKAKVTTPIRQGTQALQISADAASEGVQSDNLLSMRSSITYAITIWYQNSGSDWELWWYDGASGPSKIGDLPSTTGYESITFDITTAAAGTPYFQIISGSAGASTIYIDGINIYESYFENSATYPFDEGTDGEIDNNDEFTSSADYTFVAGDAGKYLCVYDSVNPENSGVYLITSVTAGVATLNIRTGTGALTTNTTGNLPFRVVDISNVAPQSTSMEIWLRDVGWGLESPHSSKWRIFFRHYLVNGASPKAIKVWAAPSDTEYDYETGTFLASGPSTQRQIDDAYAAGSTGNYHAWSGGYVGSGTATNRFFMMMEDDFSFFCFVVYQGNGADHGGLVAGFTGANIYNQNAKEFDLLGQKNSIVTSDSIVWTASATNMFNNGVSFDDNDWADSCCIVQYAAGTSNNSALAGACVANPFNSEEYLIPFISSRGARSGNEVSFKKYTVGLYQGRSNITDLTTFDSDQYLHITNGWVWEWNGFDLP